MKIYLPIIALLLVIAGCSTVPESSPNQLNVIETWSGYATGRGADCPDSDVQLKILEDFSIVGIAQTTEFGMTIRLKGKLSDDGKLHVSGGGAGGVTITFKGTFNGNSASGKWISNRACAGTWELAKK